MKTEDLHGAGLSVRRYSFDDIHFEVRSPDPSHLVWLDDFIAPHFRSGSIFPRRIRITLIQDREHYRICRKKFTSREVLPSFVYDSKTESLAWQPDRNDNLLLFDKTYGAFYKVSRDRKEVAILVEEATAHVRMTIVRIMREYVMNEVQRKGDFFLHASSFVTEAGPVIVTGPKMAGKTSLVIFACLMGGSRYLANDRVLLQFRENEFVLRSVPVIITIRNKTFNFFPQIKERILSEELHFRVGPGERFREVSPETVIGSEDEYDLSQSQFCQLLSAKQEREGRKPIVVFSRISGRKETFSLRSVDEREAADLLEHSRFGARYWATSTPVFNLESEGGGDCGRLEENVRRFVAQTRFVLCEVGLDLYRHPSHSHLWIRALFEAARET